MQSSVSTSNPKRKVTQQKQNNPQKRRRVLEAVTKLCYEATEEDADVLENINENLPTNSQSDGQCFNVIATTIRQTLLEITEIKERNLDRRHKELMQLLKKYLIKDSENEDTLEVAEAEAEQTADHSDHLYSLEETQYPNANKNVVVEYIVTTPGANSVGVVDDSNNAVVELSVYKKEKQLHPNEMIANKISPVGITKIKNIKSPVQNDLQIMRAKMLEMQRKKMEERAEKGQRGQIQKRKKPDVNS